MAGSFEWLTTPSSLDPLLQGVGIEGKAVLHVGSGSSLLGEHLVDNLQAHRVVNVDVDEPTLSVMQQQWLQQHPNDTRLEYCQVDLASESIPLDHESMDVAVDKSTLDCTLCSDAATAGLLAEVYRTLKVGGTYVVISFHADDLLLPMIGDCPGMQWTIEHVVVQRQVEDLLGASARTTNPPSSSDLVDNDYRRTVNVLLCRKQATAGVLCREAIAEHVHAVNDEWFQASHPLLTEERRAAIEVAFAKDQSLIDGYQVLFTEEERVYFTYDLFLLDWDAYCSSHANLPSDRLSLTTALDFLQTMQ